MRRTNEEWEEMMRNNCSFCHDQGRMQGWIEATAATLIPIALYLAYKLL